MAHVHVVVIGLISAEDAPSERRLFSYDDIKGEPVESRHSAIAPYLFDASGLTNPRLFVTKKSRPKLHQNVPKRGVQPTDGGNYIFSEDEKAEFLSREPNAHHLFRNFVGASEVIYSVQRYILEASPFRSGAPRC